MLNIVQHSGNTVYLKCQTPFNVIWNLVTFKRHLHFKSVAPLSQVLYLIYILSYKNDFDSKNQFICKSRCGLFHI